MSDGNLSSGGGDGENTDGDNPIRDYGTRVRSGVDLDEIEGHHSDKWQSRAMVVGIHIPKHRHPRKHRHHKSRKEGKEKEKEVEREETDGDNDPNTPGMDAAQRVQFILGGTDDDVEHQSHKLFCEMEELRAVGEDGDMEWKETARWIKFEEDVEEGGERWSKPHVATLSLRSLFELRRSILSGTVMLDVDADNLIDITGVVLDNWVASGQLEAEKRDRVQEVLMSRHRHQHEKKYDKEKTGLSKNPSSSGPLTQRRGSLIPLPKFGSSKDLKKSASGSDIMDSKDSTGHMKFNEHFLKKIPPGAEASNILVGEVDFLSQHTLAFLRLSKAVLLGDLTEVPVPSRFIFVMIGPQGNLKEYHEIGRSIATLMSDEVFHDVAYKAKRRSDLLAGIDEFLEQVTVLPPGEWDPSIRIEPPKEIPSQIARRMSVAPNGIPDLPPNGLALPEAEVHEEEESHGDPTLVRTGRLFGGLVRDIRRKAPFYLSDFRDALHIQSISSFFFMYFACLTPIITFGGLLGSATNNYMAAMESLMSGAICGISYHLFAGQPLTIIGSTGPVLVFETIVYNFSQDYHMHYLGLRFWIGMWVAFILLLIVAFDLSALVRYITRFTEESFALLIALIFIYEAFKKLIHIEHEAPIGPHPDSHVNYTCICDTTPQPLNMNSSGGNMSLMATEVMSVLTTAVPLNLSNILVSNSTAVHLDMEHLTEKQCKALNGTLVGLGCGHHEPVPDVFLFSIILFFGTFIICYGNILRNSRFLPAKVRSIISDFSVTIAIVTMVGMDAGVGLATPKLSVPTDFRPTRIDRPWVVNPFRNPWYIGLLAVLPALLCTILIFMDQQITAVIVNRREHKLKKGSGYHLDLFLIAIQMAICSLLGLPWFVAATVLSINHVRSLTKESESTAPGERPQFLGVREQRVTGITVFLLVGLSVLMTSILQFIPMPVLYGVFLYMGVSSMAGIQLVQRILIVFMPQKYQPDYVYLRHVPIRRVHLFTGIQVLCLAILWTIKTIKSISIVFPLMVLAMCFVRKALEWLFTRHDLKWLDDIMPEAHKREKEKKKKKHDDTEPSHKKHHVGKTWSGHDVVGATVPSESADPEKPPLPNGFIEQDTVKLPLASEDIEKKDLVEMVGGTVNIPLKDGRSINIPVDRIIYDPRSNQVAISEDMSKTAIWKQLVANESNPDIKSMDEGLRHRKMAAEEDRSFVKFAISEEDEDESPEIVVDSATKPGGILKHKHPYSSHA